MRCIISDIAFKILNTDQDNPLVTEKIFLPA